MDDTFVDKKCSISKGFYDFLTTASVTNGKGNPIDLTGMHADEKQVAMSLRATGELLEKQAHQKFRAALEQLISAETEKKKSRAKHLEKVRTFAIFFFAIFFCDSFL